MRVKIIFGRSTTSNPFLPQKEGSKEVSNAAEVMSFFKEFFVKNPELPTNPEVDRIIQESNRLTVGELMSIKYFLKKSGYDIKFFAMESNDESILDDTTQTSGFLLLNNTKKLLGFLPSGHYLRLSSEEDANPLTLFKWVATQVNLFPSYLSTNPFDDALARLKEEKNALGFPSVTTSSTLGNLVQDFGYEMVII